MPRFAILEHIGAPDDPAGRHFDLLIEAAESCRTWRLATLPEPGGPPVKAVELPLHRLDWLDHEVGEVSGGRGFARNVARGECRRLTDDSSAWSGSEAIIVSAPHSGHVFRLMPTEDGWLAVAGD